MQAAANSDFDFAKGRRKAVKKVTNRQQRTTAAKLPKPSSSNDAKTKSSNQLKAAIDAAEKRQFTRRQELADHDAPILDRLRIPEFLLPPTKIWAETASKMAARQKQDQIEMFVQDVDYQNVDWPMKDPRQMAIAEQFETATTDVNRVPILRAFGWTETGVPLRVNIHNFRPYMFARVPRDAYHPDRAQQLCNELKAYLNNVLRKDKDMRENPPVTHVEIASTESLKYHRFEMNPFFKIFVAGPGLITRVRMLLYPEKRQVVTLKKQKTVKEQKADNPDDAMDDTLEPFEHVDGEDEAKDERCMHIWGRRRRLEVFDCNVDFSLRFLIDIDMAGSTWIGLKAGKYYVRRAAAAREGSSSSSSDEDGEDEEGEQGGDGRKRFFGGGGGGNDNMVDDDAKDNHHHHHHRRGREEDGDREGEDVKLRDEEQINGRTTATRKRAARRYDERTSNYEIEIDIGYEDIVPHSPNVPPWNKMPPGLRLNSLDLEAAAAAGHFPTPTEAPVTDICMYICEYDQPDEKHWHPVSFVLGGCGKSNDRDVVFSFKNEVEMLEAWAVFIRAMRIDLFTGYNTRRFDFPYLLRRAAHLGVPLFSFWTPLFESVTAELTTFKSKGTGAQQRGQIKMSGAWEMDMYPLVLSNSERLTSYTLNNVCMHFLKMTKADMHYSLLTPMTIGPDSTDETRETVREYCRKDALLPVKLMHHLKSVFDIVEMARVTGVTVGILTRRGQGVKTMSQLMRRAKKDGLIKPFTVRVQTQVLDEFGDEVAEGDEKHEAKIKGATVIEPKRGFYENPVATLDFESLYPSIMMANNLCFSTLVHPSTLHRLDSSKYVTLPISKHMQPVFIVPLFKKGLMPDILENLLGARKVAKTAMAEAKDATSKQIYNGRQLALKISANSIYGYCTGYDVTAKAVGAAVTWFGRQLIFYSKTHVEETFTIAKGYPFDAEVIYGDTDSVMVYMNNLTKVIDRKLASKYGLEMAQSCSAKMRKPIRLAFEKIFQPYLLMNKKRYAGLKLVDDDPPKLDSKGGENVRRNGSPLVRNLIEKLFYLLLVKKAFKGAVAYVQETIRNVLAGRIDLSQLVIIARISNDNYKNKPGPARLADRIEAREPGSGPKLGDAIRYFYIRDLSSSNAKMKKSKLSDQIEEATFVLKHKLPIDYRRYIDNELIPAVTRVLRLPLVRDMPRPVERLEVQLEADKRVQHVFDQAMFEGVQIHSTSALQSPLANFVRVEIRCIGCRAPTESSHSAVCRACASRRPELIMELMYEMQKVEERYCADWTACQGCMESHHKEISCANFDCPIFFQRETLRSEVANLHRIADVLRGD